MKKSEFFYAMKKVFNNKQCFEGGRGRNEKRITRKWKEKKIKTPKVFEFAFLINFIRSKLDAKSFHPCWNSNLCRSSSLPMSSSELLKFVAKTFTHTSFFFSSTIDVCLKLMICNHIKVFPFAAQVNVKRTSNIKHEEL